jgi:hypothetical protein
VIIKWIPKIRMANVFVAEKSASVVKIVIAVKIVSVNAAKNKFYG